LLRSSPLPLPQRGRGVSWFVALAALRDTGAESPLGYLTSPSSEPCGGAEGARTGHNAPLPLPQRGRGRGL